MLLSWEARTDGGSGSFSVRLQGYHQPTLACLGQVLRGSLHELMCLGSARGPAQLGRLQREQGGRELNLGLGASVLFVPGELSANLRAGFGTAIGAPHLGWSLRFYICARSLAIAVCRSLAKASHGLPEDAFRIVPLPPPTSGSLVQSQHF